ncbi:MAG: ergothioneine biosynthesis protein EgtB [Candidatus Saccharibacteria bacterium]|nr:ergothioneine biosynthesis protein EgtB [Rhodoferax sp.]
MGSLLASYQQIRNYSLAVASPLTIEDQCVQSMPDASPTKWHLGHTTWFFETIVLQAFVTGYVSWDVRLGYLFNSYYEALGPRHPRPQRGLLTRPALADIQAYRQHVDRAMAVLIAGLSGDHPALPLIALGMNHEQQHQELMLADVLHLFYSNPLLLAYGTLPGSQPAPSAGSDTLQWLAFAGGALHMGWDDTTALQSFAFDNETPRHLRQVAPFQLAHRLVSCEEYLAFVNDGGYSNPMLWLSDGWAQVQVQAWNAPQYWIAPGDPRCPHTDWQVFGLQGVQPLDPSAPVTHLSFYEAAAFAEWAGARLPTEFEWEHAFGAPALKNMQGQAWQWTRSAYEPYPGFRPRSGAVQEYNGKFMVGQQVLRGSSLATSAGHSRATYRNFFPPATRWQFAGLRLAQ